MGYSFRRFQHVKWIIELLENSENLKYLKRSEERREKISTRWSGVIKLTGKEWTSVLYWVIHVAWFIFGDRKIKSRGGNGTGVASEAHIRCPSILGTKPGWWVGANRFFAPKRLRYLCNPDPNRSSSSKSDRILRRSSSSRIVFASVFMSPEIFKRRRSIAVDQYRKIIETNSFQTHSTVSLLKRTSKQVASSTTSARTTVRDVQE